MVNVDYEFVICSAVKLDDGRIFYGHRHHTAIGAALDAQATTHVRVDQCGFVTSRGRFVDRVEGLKIQKEAGIESHDRGVIS